MIEQFGHRVIAHPWVYRLGADVAVMVSGNAMAHVYVDLGRRRRPFLKRHVGTVARTGRSTCVS